MKKTLLAVAFALFAMASNAQVFVGGGLGFSSAKHEDAKHSSTTFSFSPEVGYVLSETLSIGLPISINTSKTAYQKAWDQEGTTSWSVAPYARYTFFNSGILSCFVDGVLGFSGVQDDDTTVSLAVCPGVAVSVADNVSVVTRLGSLGWNNQGGDGSYFGLNADTSISSVSLYYTF